MNNDEKNWGMLCHIAVFAGYIIPGGNILGPLVIWLMKKDDYSFVDHQGKEVINFQITVTIALVIALILAFIFIGFLLIAAIGIASLVFTVLAIIKTSEGLPYAYPMSYKFIK